MTVSKYHKNSWWNKLNWPIKSLKMTNKITHLPYLLDSDKKLIPNSKIKNSWRVFLSLSLCASDYPGDFKKEKLSYMFITFRDNCSISLWSSDIQSQLLRHSVPLRTASGNRVCAFQSKPRKWLRAGGVEPIKLTSQPPFRMEGRRGGGGGEIGERPEYSTSVLLQ